MRVTRISKAVALTAASALMLSACATTGGNEGDGGGGDSGGSKTVTVAEVNGLNSLNSNTSEGNVDVNGKVEYATSCGFGYINPQLEVVHNEKFGTYKKVSDDPMVVEYEITSDAKWSDGTPVTAHDLVLNWAIDSGWYDDAETNDDGDITNGGTRYFTPAGSVTQLNPTKFPEVSEDGKKFTLEYTKPNADWEIALGMLEDMKPAHIIAKKAGFDSAEAFTNFLKDRPKGDPKNVVEPSEQLQKAADFWNTGYDTKTMPDDQDVLVNCGPYLVSAMVADQSVTLTKNPDFAWGEEPKVDEVVVRFIGEAPNQIQALRNGEVDFISPQPSADTKTELEGLDGIQIQEFLQLSYDHVDLNFSGVFEDRNVREAFMKVIPREDIVNKVVGDIIPDATPLDSQIFVPDNEPYEEAVRTNGSADFQEVDIEGAKKLLDGKQPEVRILYNNENPNRADTFTLIRESAEQAGFKIVDTGRGKSDWSPSKNQGQYDVSIFGWVSPGVGVAGMPQIYGTRKGTIAGNYNNYSNPEVDKLIEQIVTEPDKSKQEELQVQVDKHLFEDRYGLPLFQSPKLNAHRDRMTGTEAMPNQRGVFWNIWNWDVSD